MLVLIIWVAVCYLDITGISCLRVTNILLVDILSLDFFHLLLLTKFLGLGNPLNKKIATLHNFQAISYDYGFVAFFSAAAL